MSSIMAKTTLKINKGQGGNWQQQLQKTLILSLTWSWRITASQLIRLPRGWSSQGRADYIIRYETELGMSNVSARWVPRLLTPEQEHTRCRMSRENLALFEDNPSNFLEQFVDEAWVHHYQSETKEQSKQWKHPMSPTPKKVKVTPSAGKVMASVFWDAQGVLPVDYLQNGYAINGQYYSDLLKRQRENIKKKRPEMITKGVLFHRDTSPSHSSMVAMATIRDCAFQLVPHPPYSPDLAPSDFHLFPNLKKDLAG